MKTRSCAAEVLCNLFRSMDNKVLLALAKDLSEAIDKEEEDSLIIEFVEKATVIFQFDDTENKDFKNLLQDRIFAHNYTHVGSDSLAYLEEIEYVHFNILYKLASRAEEKSDKN
eukprot:TRINITY_DN125752_c0_g3_i2.p1 TRINITY_DN125752_c0_g3~~TRINITY_DN125752_c0_g3_i2.p1  ORF type:complete len:114 (+),score=23.68 TRINITY_DN125752_c0_g3_i2:267-608(+)